MRAVGLAQSGWPGVASSGSLPAFPPRRGEGSPVGELRRAGRLGSGGLLTAAVSFVGEVFQHLGRCGMKKSLPSSCVTGACCPLCLNLDVQGRGVGRGGGGGLLGSL